MQPNDCQNPSYYELQKTSIELLERCQALIKTNEGVFFETQKLVLNPEGAKFVAEQFINKLNNEKIDTIGAINYKAIPIISHICLYSKLTQKKTFPVFFTRREKGYGLNKRIEGIIPKNNNRVALMMDEFNNEEYLLKEINDFNISLKKEHHVYNKIEHIFSLFDRNNGAKQIVEENGYKLWSLFEKTKDGFKFNGY